MDQLPLIDQVWMSLFRDALRSRFDPRYNDAVNAQKSAHLADAALEQYEKRFGKLRRSDGDKVPL